MERKKIEPIPKEGSEKASETLTLTSSCCTPKENKAVCCTPVKEPASSEKCCEQPEDGSKCCTR